MNFHLKPGERRRMGDSWVRRDRVVVEGRLLRGYIETMGRRKRPDAVVTKFGAESRRGSEPYWLMHCNGISTDNAV